MLLPWSVNILIISNLFPPYIVGGYEVACEQFVRGFAHDRVTVLTSSYGVPGPRVDGDVIRVLPIVSDECLPGLHLPPGVRRFFAPEVMQLTARWIRKVRPDLCYLWNLRALSIGPLVAARVASVPVVYHFEDAWLPDVVFHPDPRIERAKRLLASRFVSGVGRTGAIFVSRFLQCLYTSRGYEFPRNAVIPNGIQIDRSAAERYPRVGGVACRFLFVGRIVPDKGVATLIDAMQHARSLTSSPLQLTVAGDGPSEYVARLREQARGHGLTVCWLGRIAQDNLPAVYAGHEVVVMPSTWDEPFGLVAIEAMAAGRAVLASDSGALPEIVKPQLNGLLVPRGDPRALGEAIASLADDPSLVRRLGEQAARDVRARFDLVSARASARKILEEVACT